MAYKRLRVLARPLLHKDVTDIVRDRIVEGQLPENQLIPEVELGQNLGVSRTPIREALKVLAAEGLVTMIPNRGAIVTALFAQQAHELITFLAELEGLAADWACIYATDKDLSGLVKDHQAMLKAHTAGKMHDYFKLNQHIHNEIVRLAGNEPLLMAHATCSGRLQRIRYLSNMSARAWEEAADDHAELMVLLQTRARDKVRECARRHVLSIWPIVKPLLKAQTSSGLNEVRRSHRRGNGTKA